MKLSEKITISYGEGGRLTHQLIRGFVERFSNPILDKLDDSALFSADKNIAFTTDSYVVHPIFFSGGDIGKLSVYGTVNDLSMAGAVPMYILLSLIIEEGFFQSDLDRIMDSVKEAADEAGVKIVGGDTKVVPRGVCDKIFINTSGIGFVDEGVNISSQNAEVGDAIIVSGGISEHGIAILSDREGLGFGIESDCAPLNWLVQDMLRQSRNIHCLRDLTRGGLATCLCEIAESSGVGMRIAEDMIPIKEEVKGACEILGFDPLYIASEGRLLAILPRDDAERVLAAMRRNRLGSSAQIVGEVIDDSKLVRLCTRIGGERILDILQGEQLPRIC